MNPLVSDKNVDFLLSELLGLERDSYALVLDSVRKLAREVFFPAFKPMDEHPPRLEGGQVRVHPAMRELWRHAAELGLLAPMDAPLAVSTMASHYLMAANCAAFGYIGLTKGAAHLVEAFGDEYLKREFLPRMHSGEWTGTMALTEPQAGSALGEVRTRARPRDDGTFSIDGNKVFISGGDQDFTGNIVHLTLARIEGAPAGTKGISLFAIPKKRLDGADNDCTSAGVFHKMGWRGLPSIALNFGERGDCRGWLVGAPHQGLKYMFQMMNEARLMVGLNGASTASAAYFESLEYAKTRLQPRVPIIEHADVRRMLLRQKAIVEGSVALLAVTAHYADQGNELLVDLLTPIAKTFPAEYGFESNTLAVQIHGGYGYTSEYLPEAWLRDQKLNTIHEGTSGIQALDLVGRKVLMTQGASLRALAQEIGNGPLDAIIADIATVTPTLTHASDYLQMLSIVVIAWMWLKQAKLAEGKEGAFYAGKRAAAQYWLRTELPKAKVLAELIRSGEDSYDKVQPDEL